MTKPVRHCAALLIGLAFCEAASADGLQVDQSVKTMATAFTSDAPDGMSNNAYEASVLYTAKTNVFLSDEVTLAVSGFLQGSPNSGRKGILVGPNENDSRSPLADFIEVGLRWDGENASFKIGKWKQNYEFAERLSVLNRYNLSDYTVPLNTVGTGNWLAQWQQFIGDGHLNVTIMPFHPSTGHPAEHSRWYGVSGGGTLIASDIPGSTVRSGKPDISVIWEGSAERFDYTIGASRAQSQYSVIRLDTTKIETVEEYPDALALFGGFSLPSDGNRFFVEAYYQDTADGRDDDFLRVSAGASFGLFEYAEKLDINDLKFAVEFLADRTVRKQSNPGYSIPSSLSRPLQNALNLSLTANLTEKWTFQQEFTRGFSKRDSWSVSQVSYDIDDSTKVSARYVRIDGNPDTSLYGKWKHNDNFTIEFTRNF